MSAAWEALSNQITPDDDFEALVVPLPPLCAEKEYLLDFSLDAEYLLYKGPWIPSLEGLFKNLPLLSR